MIVEDAGNTSFMAFNIGATPSVRPWVGARAQARQNVESVKRTQTIESKVRERKATWFWPELPDDGEFRLDMLRD